MTGTDADTITLESPIEPLPGDRLYLVDAWPEALEDGESSRHLAGLPGTAFAKVLTDRNGNRHVPHYAAIDIASDNRIGPGTNAVTQHRFEIPSGCTEGEVRATVLYRPIPIHLADLRGWDATDAIIATGSSTW